MRTESPPTAPRLPVVVELTDSPDSACLSLEVPADLVWFDGHFPSAPILPGVAQIGWAIAYARERFGLDADPTRIERVKFLHTVHPRERLTLELKREHSAVRWRFCAAETLLSQGRLLFAPA